MTEATSSAPDDGNEAGPSEEEKVRLKAAAERLQGSDGLESLGSAAAVIAAGSAGAMASGAIAAHFGATTLFGSSALAGALPFLAASTPIGWVVGAAAGAGTVAYGLSKVIRSGARNTERRVNLRGQILQRIDKAQVRSKVKASEPVLLAMANRLVDAAVMSATEVDELFRHMKGGDISVDRCHSLLSRMLSENGLNLSMGRISSDPPSDISEDAAPSAVSDLERDEAGLEASRAQTETIADAAPPLLSENPEFMLEHLLNALAELGGAIGALDDGELRIRLGRVFQQIMILHIMNESPVIAVTGTQGAGKTTLMTLLYELDDKWLSGNEGRGERVPVLIQEADDISEPQGQLLKQVRMQDARGSKISTVVENVDRDQFRQAISGQLDDVILPRLLVPVRYYGASSCRFLLMPGHEKITSRNAGWQRMLRRTLTAAGMCIVVTDETRLANQNQKEILTAFTSDLKGSEPIVVITKTEGVDIHKREALVNRAGEVFELAASSLSQRVVCSSTSPEDRSHWVDALIDATDILGTVSDEYRSRQIKNLHELLSDELMPLIRDIDSASSDDIHREVVTSNVIDKILKEFDRSQSGLRREYLSELGRLLERHAQNATANAMAIFEEREQGVVNLAKSGWRWLTVSESEQEKILPSYASQAWERPYESMGGQFFSLREAYLDLLYRLAKRRLGGSIDGASLNAAHSVSEATQWKRPSESNIHDLRLLLGSNGTMSEEASLSKDVLESIGLLPVLLISYVHLSSRYPGLLGDNFEHAVEEGRALSEAEISNGLAPHEKSILAALAVFAGVGAGPSLADTAVAEGLSVNDVADEGSESGVLDKVVEWGGAASFIPHAAVLSATLGFTINFAKSVQRAQGRERETLRRMITTICDKYHVQYSVNFDGLMENGRRMLENRLKTRYKSASLLMQQDRLVKSIEQTRSLCYDIKASIAKNHLFTVD